MKEKDITKSIRAALDGALEKRQYKFKNRSSSYMKYDGGSKLYFEIVILYYDKATLKNDRSKYIELFLNIYHEYLSKKE